MTPKQREPTPPGQVFIEQFLSETQQDAARKMGIAATYLGDIIHGRRNVSTRVALIFAQYTKTTPEFWLNLQMQVDLYDAGWR
jgi:addiction module HigA family antidote